MTPCLPRDFGREFLSLSRPILPTSDPSWTWIFGSRNLDSRQTQFICPRVVTPCLTDSFGWHAINFANSSCGPRISEKNARFQTQEEEVCGLRWQDERRAF